ncbi:MAG: PAS domain S-box protein [Anaerolineae bacterium]|jgi:PAS domain S-box-containing protein|nr:PAS domain S-box protein [Anaerolineae bacterium]
MQERIRGLLKAPTFADEMKNAQAEILNRVIFLLFIVMCLVFILAARVALNPLAASSFVGAAIGFLVFVWWLSRRNYTQTASILLIIGLYLINGLSTLIWGGIGAPMTGGHILLILMTGMLLGVRAAVIGTAVSVTWLFSLGIIQIAQGTQYRQLDLSLESQLMVHLLFIVMVGGLVILASEMLGRSFRRLQQGDAKLRNTLEQLQLTTFSKDYIDNILRSMSNMLIVVDSHGMIRTINPTALRVLGYSERELIGKPFNNIALQEGTSEVSGEDATRSGEALLITKSRAYLQVTVFQSVMRDSDGHMTGMIYQMEDMSDRRRIESEKMRSAMRYRALFEQANDAIFLLNVQGSHLAVNQRATQMLGYSFEELTKMSYRDIVVEREHDRSDQVLERLLKNERIAPFYERVFRRKDGSEINVEINVELVRDADGNPLHIQSIVRDITARKQIERQLNYQAKLLQSVSDAIVSMDMDTVILSWNRAAEQVYGWKEKEALGQRFDQLVPTVFEHDSENFIREKYLQRGYWRSEVTQLRRDGKQLYMLTSVSLLRDADDQMIGTVSINHDITARKEAETELEQRLVQLAALRQVDVEITSTLQIDQVLHVALSSAFVLSSAEAGFVLLCENDRFYLKDAIGEYEGRSEINREIQPHGTVQRAIETRHALLIPNVHQDAHYVADLPETQSQIVIPLTAHDQLIGILNLETSQEDNFTPAVFDFVKLLMTRVAVALDNARLYELSQRQLQELTESSKRVSQLEQLKTDMIRIASHDLRNPIGVIKGYLEVVETDILPKLNEDEREYIDAIRRNIMRIQTIITDILSLERIEQVVRTGKGEFVDLGDMVRRVIYEIEPHAELKQLDLHNQVSAEQIFVQADPAQLHEAIFNLIENAIKYTYEYGRVEVKLYRMDGQARFSVTDTGIGIPAEYQARLFEPFFRAKTPESVDIEGTGLGLHLVKNIIERYQGTMFFSSAYHQGSTFGFIMPLVEGT